MYEKDDREKVLRIFDKTKAIIKDSHIVYTSGKHGSSYVNKDALYPYTAETSYLCSKIAEEFALDNVDVVIAPAIGGVVLSQWVAFHLSKITSREVLAVYAEKAEGGNVFVIKRGYDKLISCKNVLVVEDVLTTGGSVKKVIIVTQAAGGRVIGLGVLCNRGQVRAQDVANIPKLFSLVSIDLDMWDEKRCPLCVKNIPINTNVGKGREFIMNR